MLFNHALMANQTTALEKQLKRLHNFRTRNDCRIFLKYLPQIFNSKFSFNYQISYNVHIFYVIYGTTRRVVAAIIHENPRKFWRYQWLVPKWWN